ncbi:uncharacterized protein LOC110683247 [Chenopodium quinoa]|uniref:uncharacterized protein LOC110683247 n=1 Tax=Chenopodium quinoa TaxID=63459 RepID=UPI000B773172|nr:uncharacterized protein LOC110683247 [Chenopodium quinoa]
MRSIYASASLPILMFRDFNERDVIRGERQIDVFREAIDYCECRDLGFRGNVYTWQRGTSIKTSVCERLDRFIASNGWCSLFPDFEVLHLPSRHSDHVPILLKCGESEVRRANEKNFRFKALWLSKEECGQVVSKAWRDDECAPIHEQITRVAQWLSTWASSTFGVLKKKIRKAEG